MDNILGSLAFLCRKEVKPLALELRIQLRKEEVMSRKLFLAILVLVCTVALTIMGTSVEASQFKRKFLKMDSGPQAASWYPLGAGMMRLFEKATGISTSNRPGGGGKQPQIC